MFDATVNFLHRVHVNSNIYRPKFLVERNRGLHDVLSLWLKTNPVTIMWHIVFDNYGVRILISKTISLISVNVIAVELMSHASLLINFDLPNQRFLLVVQVAILFLARY